MLLDFLARHEHNWRILIMESLRQIDRQYVGITVHPYARIPDIAIISFLFARLYIPLNLATRGWVTILFSNINSEPFHSALISLHIKKLKTEFRCTFHILLPPLPLTKVFGIPSLRGYPTVLQKARATSA